jgi:hypothetical protein
MRKQKTLDETLIHTFERAYLKRKESLREILAAQKTSSPETMQLSEQLRRLREDAQARENEIQSLEEKLKKHSDHTLQGHSSNISNIGQSSITKPTGESGELGQLEANLATLLKSSSEDDVFIQEMLKTMGTVMGDRKKKKKSGNNDSSALLL